MKKGVGLIAVAGSLLALACWPAAGYAQQRLAESAAITDIQNSDKILGEEQPADAAAGEEAAPEETELTAEAADVEPAFPNPDTAPAPAAGQPVSTGAPIEATVEEIQALISLPPTAQLGREADEALDKPQNLFTTESVRQQLLGEAPRFVYIPEGVDPMIIPWVRNKIVAGELLADAQAMLVKAQSAGDKAMAQRALDISESIITQFSDTPQVSGAKAVAESSRRIIQHEVVVDDAGQTPTQTVVELPKWISSNTKGVVVDLDNPQDSVILLGDYILHPGDKVQRFPAVKVKQALPSQVIYLYQDLDFLVTVKASQ